MPGEGVEQRSAAGPQQQHSLLHLHLSKVIRHVESYRVFNNKYLFFYYPPASTYIHIYLSLFIHKHYLSTCLSLLYVCLSLAPFYLTSNLLKIWVRTLRYLESLAAEREEPALALSKLSSSNQSCSQPRHQSLKLINALDLKEREVTLPCSYRGIWFCMPKEFGMEKIGFLSNVSLHCWQLSWL